MGLGTADCCYIVPIFLVECIAAFIKRVDEFGAFRLVKAIPS